MDWKSDDIIKCFNGVIKDSKYMTSEQLDSKYSKFKENFSKLYSVAIDSVMSGNIQEAHNILTMMLKARENMINGKSTKLTTDMFVGNQLGKKYIYPKTNIPSQDDYIQAIQKIKQKTEDNDKIDNNID